MGQEAAEEAEEADEEAAESRPQAGDDDCDMALRIQHTTYDEIVEELERTARTSRTTPLSLLSQARIDHEG